MCEVRIGAQGWNYDAWVGAFYPPGTRATEYLDLYCRAFDTVEIDSTFYAIPSEASITSWSTRAPEDFRYSLKLPREITHERRLDECDDLLNRFCDRVRGLGNRVASVLIQLPPDFSPHSYQLLERFVPLLPADIKFAVEFRDRSWIGEEFCERILDLFVKHGVALTLADSKWIPREVSLSLIDRPTAPFAYVRWMGPRVLSNFSRVQINRDRELAQWAAAFATLQRRVDAIYGYFNNHYQGHSPASCNQFKRLIGQPVVEPDALVVQPLLF